jgi:hypothetical protein
MIIIYRIGQLGKRFIFFNILSMETIVYVLDDCQMGKKDCSRLVESKKLYAERCFG